MSELRIDPNIRTWVFLPLVIVTLLVGVLRHYVSLCLASRKDVTLRQVENAQVLHRVHLLRRNGNFLPKAGFLARKYYLREVLAGLLKTEKQQVQQHSSTSRITDPAVFSEMMKCNVTNLLPMVLVGGWINWMFSGFVTTKVPFPLTLRFKPMLQRGIDLQYLDASWVSSASWYFLNVVGLRAIYYLILGEDNLADGISFGQDQNSGFMSSFAAAATSVYKGEYETLALLDHNCCIKSAYGLVI